MRLFPLPRSWQKAMEQWTPRRVGARGLHHPAACCCRPGPPTRRTAVSRLPTWGRRLGAAGLQHHPGPSCRPGPLTRRLKRDISGLALMTPLLLALPCSADVPVGCSLEYDRGAASNQVLLSWEAIPTKLYNVLTATALENQPWLPLNPAPLLATNNLVKFWHSNDLPARFYKVVKLDTDQPEIWRLNPASNAILWPFRIPRWRSAPLQSFGHPS
jgi:hypothetical protein